MPEEMKTAVITGAASGIGLATGQVLTPGAKVDVHVYLRPRRPVPIHLRFQLVAWPLAGEPTAAVTRWRISVRPSSPMPVPGVGRPRWLLELLRCRCKH